MFVLAAAVVFSLAAGLVIWAPWSSPPVLRPAGLVAGPFTANSIAFRWSRPVTGPLPDRYLVLSKGTMAGSVAGTVRSYRQTGLTPATPYQYRVVAVRGGKRSPQSDLLTVSTLTPPISRARLQGAWEIRAKNNGPAPGGRNGSLFWQLSPACAAGACDVTLRGQNGGDAFTVKLTRTGAVYSGQAMDKGRLCGSAVNSVPDPETLKIRIRVTHAVGENKEWVATSWVGTMAGTYHFVSSATFYCRAFTYTASLSGSPA